MSCILVLSGENLIAHLVSMIFKDKLFAYIFGNKNGIREI